MTLPAYVHQYTFKDGTKDVLYSNAKLMSIDYLEHSKYKNLICEKIELLCLVDTDNINDIKFLKTKIYPDYEQDNLIDLLNRQIELLEEQNTLLKLLINE